jgi:hypothetical protein
MRFINVFTSALPPTPGASFSLPQVDPFEVAGRLN